MKVDDIPIPEPCDADWSTMTGDERRRFCGLCQKHVTDISTFTRREAQGFLDENPEACIQYTAVYDDILFVAPARQTSRRARPGRWVRRIAQLGALSLAAGTPAMAAGDAADGGSLVQSVIDWWWGEETKAETPEARPEAKPVETKPPVAPVRITRGARVAHPKPPPAPSAIPEVEAKPPVRRLGGRPRPR